MEVRINDDYFIESDSRNFILRIRQTRESRKNPGEKTEYWDYAYFGHIEHLFHYVIERTVRDSDATSLLEMRSLIQSAKNDVLQCIKSTELLSFFELRDQQYPPVVQKKPKLEPKVDVAANADVVPMKRGRGRPKKNRG